MLIDGVFEGGGIKGLSYIGAIKFFEERGIKFFRVGGTSVGAIFASLIATGYGATEMERLVNELNYKILKPNSISYMQALKEKGLYSLSSLESYLDSLFMAKGKRYFKDLKYGNDYILKIVATDITDKRMVVLPNDLIRYGIDPDNFKIASAVVMSSTLPFIYKPYRLNNHLFFDGGIVSNFPINYMLFEEDDLPVIGFRFNSKEAPNMIKKVKNKFFKIDNFLSTPKKGTIFIDTFNIKASDFKKGLIFKESLYKSGYNAAQKFFYDNFK